MIDPIFFTLQANKLTRVVALFKQRNWARLLVMMAFLAIFFLLAGGVFLFSLMTFIFLGGYPEYNQPVITYSLAITFVFTAVLILASSMITSLGTLFQREDNSLLFSSPIEIGTIFESRLLDTIFLSIWPLFVFAFPLILGYGRAFRLGFSTIFLFLVGLFFLALSSTLLGAIVALFISRLWGNLKGKFLMLFLLLVIPALGISLIGILLPSQLMGNLGELSIGEISQLLSRQVIMTKFLPTTWLVNLVYFGPSNLRFGLENLLALILFYLPILATLYLLRDKFYYGAVNKTAEGRFIAAPWDVVEKRARPFPYLLPGRMGALTEKDWLVTLRSSPQLFQLGFIFFLELIYFLVISRIPMEKFAQALPDWQPEKLVMINFFFIGYLVSVFAMRYVFPLISLEGQSSWIVWSAPIKRIKIFWQKLISSFLIIFLWMETSALILIKILGLPLAPQWPLLLVNLPLALTITFITLGIGAIKPNFWERNPEKLSTSPGGLAATAACLGYIAVVTFFLFVQKEPFSFMPHLAVWFISGLVISPILFLVYQRINQYEI
jgi:hypothetical protein